MMAMQPDSLLFDVEAARQALAGAGTAPGAPERTTPADAPSGSEKVRVDGPAWPARRLREAPSRSPAENAGAPGSGSSAQRPPSDTTAHLPTFALRRGVASRGIRSGAPLRAH